MATYKQRIPAERPAYLRWRAARMDAFGARTLARLERARSGLRPACDAAKAEAVEQGRDHETEELEAELQDVLGRTTHRWLELRSEARQRTLTERRGSRYIV